MELEQELKLLPKVKINKSELLQILKENGFQIQEENGEVVSQEDTYFDNRANYLRNSNSSIRLRKKDGKKYITYKRPTKANTTFETRKETEIQVPDRFIYEEDINSNMVKEILSADNDTNGIPEDLEKQIIIKNNRNIILLKASDGSIIEMCLDNLTMKDNSDNTYDMGTEIEFELREGNPQHLNNIYEIISDSDLQFKKNNESKYSRGMKIAKEELSIDEKLLGNIFSSIMNSEEFEALKFKGQLFSNYSIINKVTLDEYKDVNSVLDDMLQAKLGNVNKKDAQTNIRELIKLFISDCSYEECSKICSTFLNDNLLNKNTAISNRYTHSLTVMLTSMLIAKKIDLENIEILKAGLSGLTHDIGHVPYSHTCEKLLESIDGFFSHEKNGKEVIERVFKENEQNIKDKFPKNDTVNKIYTDVTTAISEAILCHSRTNCQQRDGVIISQIVRVSDKIGYFITDNIDSIKYQLRKNEENARNLEFDPFGENSNDTILNILSKVNKENLGILEEDRKTGKLKTFSLRSIEEHFNNIKDKALNESYGDIINYVVESMNSHEALDADGNEITHIDVEKNLWKLMLMYIDNVKRARGENDNEKMPLKKPVKSMQIVTLIGVTGILKETLKQTNGDPELAWKKALEKLSKTDERTFHKYAIEFNKKREEEIIELQKKKGEKLNSEEMRNLDIYEEFKKLAINYCIDNQVKLEADNIDVAEMLQKLGIDKYELTTRTDTDIYFDTKDKALIKNGESMCIVFVNGMNPSIYYKKPTLEKDKTKGKTLQRKVYALELNDDDSIEEAVQKLKENYPELKIPDGLEKVGVIKNPRKIYDVYYGKENIVINSDAPIDVERNRKISSELEILGKSKKTIEKIVRKIREMYGVKLTTETKIEKLLNSIQEKDKNNEDVVI